MKRLFSVLTIIAWLPFGFGLALLSPWLFGWRVFLADWLLFVLFGPAALWCFVAALITHLDRQ